MSTDSYLKFLWVIVLVVLAGPPAWAQDAKPANKIETVAGKNPSQWARDLKNSNRLVRARAVLMLGQFPTGAEKYLLVALNDQEPAVRFWAADQIGQAKQAGALETLRTKLYDPSPGVRLAVAFALARLGVMDEPLAMLENGLKGDRATACTAADFLARIGPPAKLTVPALERATKHKDYHVWGAAKRALKNIDPSRDQ